MYRRHGTHYGRARWSLAYQEAGAAAVAGVRHKAAYGGPEPMWHLPLIRRGRHRRESAATRMIRVRVRGPLARHGARLAAFGVIGAAVFAGGLLLQLGLVREAHCGPIASYVIQVFLSIQVSFLLNRWWTWRDRHAPFATALWRFNASKIATTILNFLLYTGLIWMKVNYLLANFLLTALFTLANYVLGDAWAFGAEIAADSSSDTTS